MPDSYLQIFFNILDNEVENSYTIVANSSEVDDIYEFPISNPSLIQSSDNTVNDQLVTDLNNLLQSIPTEVIVVESEIADKIYSSSYLEFPAFFQKVKKILIDINEDIEDWDKDKQMRLKTLRKIFDRAELYFHQKQTFYLSLKKELEDRYNELNVGIKNAKTELEDRYNELNVGIKHAKTELIGISKEIKKIEEQATEKIQSMYGEIIGILGVFSSFVFVMFGGFSALSDIVKSLSKSHVSIIKTLLIANILMYFILTVVYFLLFWVSKIINKSIVTKSCDCDVCSNPFHAIWRHRFYVGFISLNIISIIIAICILCHNNQFN